MKSKIMTIIIALIMLALGNCVYAYSTHESDNLPIQNFLDSSNWTEVDQSLTSRTGSQSIIFNTHQGFGHYRIWIENSSEVNNIVVLTSASGIKFTYYINANSTLSIYTTANGEWGVGRHSLSVSSSDGRTLSGEIKIDIGKEPI